MSQQPPPQGGYPQGPPPQGPPPQQAAGAVQNNLGVYWNNALQIFLKDPVHWAILGLVGVFAVGVGMWGGFQRCYLIQQQGGKPEIADVLWPFKSGRGLDLFLGALIAGIGGPFTMALWGFNTPIQVDQGPKFSDAMNIGKQETGKGYVPYLILFLVGACIMYIPVLGWIVGPFFIMEAYKEKFGLQFAALQGAGAQPPQMPMGGMPMGLPPGQPQWQQQGPPQGPPPGQQQWQQQGPPQGPPPGQQGWGGGPPPGQGPPQQPPMQPQQQWGPPQGPPPQQPQQQWGQPQGPPPGPPPQQPQQQWGQPQGPPPGPPPQQPQQQWGQPQGPPAQQPPQQPPPQWGQPQGPPQQPPPPLPPQQPQQQWGQVPPSTVALPGGPGRAPGFAEPAPQGGESPTVAMDSAAMQRMADMTRGGGQQAQQPADEEEEIYGGKTQALEIKPVVRQPDGGYSCGYCGNRLPPDAKATCPFCGAFLIGM